MGGWVSACPPFVSIHYTHSLITHESLWVESQPLPETIKYVTSTGKNLERVVGLIEGAVVGERDVDIMMGCLSIILVLQAPSIDRVELMSGIKSISEHIALWASSIENPIDPSKAN